MKEVLEELVFILILERNSTHFFETDILLRRRAALVSFVVDFID